MKRVIFICLPLFATLIWQAKPVWGMEPAWGMELIIKPSQGSALTLQVEVAKTPEARRLGLMGREEIAIDEGLLMIFSQSRSVCLWMKNTPLNLAVAFVDSQYRVIRAVSLWANDEKQVCEEGVRYVLEAHQQQILNLEAATLAWDL